MRNLKFSILFLIIINISCIKDYHIDYLYSNKKDKCISIIQYHKISEPLNKGIFFVPEYSNNGIPTSNYVFTRYSDYPFYVKWGTDTIWLIFPGWDLLKTKITSPNIVISTEFSENEKIKYNFYTDRKNFYKNIIREYKEYTTNDLTQNW
jgi:hypothetical protein